ncbi:MAG TPA: hypothetical protein VFN13_13480 [Rudaea sp.]|nr:hypothetical protein [Rudaea sp.]
MRTTIDIPERDHAIFLGLAHAQGTSLSNVVVELARRGLAAPAGIQETAADCPVDPLTGLGIYRSGRVVTIDDVKALEDEDDDTIAGR